MRECIKKFNPDSEYFFHEGCFIIEMLNDSDDQGVSVARARVGPGFSTKNHRLRGIMERYLILEGEGVATVGTLDPRTVGAGDMVVIPPYCPQRITNTGCTDLIFLVICTPRFQTSGYEEIDNNMNGKLPWMKS